MGREMVELASGKLSSRDAKESRSDKKMTVLVRESAATSLGNYALKINSVTDRRKNQAAP